MKLTVMIDGIPEVVGNLQRLQTVLTKQGNTSAWNGAQHLFSRTRAVVPYLDGDLYNAAYMANISTDKKSVWAVGYDTVAVPYAWDTHEIPNRIHPTRGPSNEPKQDHFLSEPRDAMTVSWPKQTADEMRGAIGRVRILRRRR